MNINLLLSFLLLISIENKEPEFYELKVNLVPKESNCTMKLGVYTSQENFLSENVTYVSFVFDPSVRDTIIYIPKGENEVAIASYEDCNSNDLLDINLIGIPKEPYAITNKARSKWREPTFEEAKIDLNLVKQISVDFDYWKNK